MTFKIGLQRSSPERMDANFYGSTKTISTVSYATWKPIPSDWRNTVVMCSSSRKWAPIQVLLDTRHHPPTTSQFPTFLFLILNHVLLSRLLLRHSFWILVTCLTVHHSAVPVSLSFSLSVLVIFTSLSRYWSASSRLFSLCSRCASLFDFVKLSVWSQGALSTHAKDLLRTRTSCFIFIFRFHNATIGCLNRFLHKKMTCVM